MNRGIRYFEAGGPSDEPASAPAPAADAATQDIPVVDRTYGVGVGNTQFTQQQINDALRAELAARPNTTYGQMLNFAQQQYGLSPEQVQKAYDSIQGVVTTSNQPSPGGIYSFSPAPYQPVRYTPQYDQYGQGIASLFGRGYSQYFQPPGLTGTYFFGSQPGGEPTYVPPGGTGPSGTGPGGTRPPPPPPPPPRIPAGFTPGQAAQYTRLGAPDRGTYEKTVNIYNAPTGVQTDASNMKKFMSDNKLSVADMARLTGATEQQITSYLGQAGLSDAQVGRYTQLNPMQQEQYAGIAKAYGSPGNLGQDITQVKQVMAQNNLTANDVAAITGVPVSAVNDYLAQDYSAYVAPSDVGTIESRGYTTDPSDLADAYLEASKAGVTGDQFIAFARDVGYTDEQIEAAYNELQSR